MASVAIQAQARRLWTAALMLPLGARILTCALICGTSILAALRWWQVSGVRVIDYAYLVLVPSRSWLFPWTLLTSSICTTSWVEFLFYVMVVPLSAPYLEQQWGTKELLLFSTIITVVTNIITWILALLISTVQMAVGIPSGKLSMLHSHFDGMHIVLTGFLVAYAQLMQDQSVFLAYSYRIRDLLMLLIGLTNIPILLGFVAPFFQVQVAWIVAWVYLRFYQYGLAGQRGDASESFAFVEYFPTFIRPFLSPVMHSVHRIVSAWDLLPSAARYTDLELSISNVPLVDARTEAERRRTMALSALDSRSSSDKAQMQVDSDLASRLPAKGVVPGLDRDAGHKLRLGSDKEAAPVLGFSAASAPIPRPMPSMTSTAPGPASRTAAPSVAGADLSPSSAT